MYSTSNDLSLEESKENEKKERILQSTVENPLLLKNKTIRRRKKTELPEKRIHNNSWISKGSKYEPIKNKNGEEHNISLSHKKDSVQEVRNLYKAKKKFRGIWNIRKRRTRISWNHHTQRKKKKASFFIELNRIIINHIRNGINRMNHKYSKGKSMLYEFLLRCVQVNKYLLYTFMMYVLINMALLLFTIFLYFCLYFYVIPQNKYVYPMDFALIDNLIEEYLEYQQQFPLYTKEKNFSFDHSWHKPSYESHQPMNPKSDKKQFEPREEYYAKLLNDMKEEILKHINDNRNVYYDSQECKGERRSASPIRKSRNDSFVKYERMNSCHDHCEPTRLKTFYKMQNLQNIQNNILLGVLPFDKTSKEQKYFLKKIIDMFFLFFMRRNKEMLNVKKGYRMDLVLQFSYINNDYNDNIDFIQLITELYDKNNKMLLNKKKLYINNKNYEFIRKLQFLMTIPFCFFNLCNKKTENILLVDQYEYIKDLGQIKIYMNPPLQIFKTYLIIQVHVNFIYYYIYRFPILFFFVFVSCVFGLLILLNSIIFFFIAGFSLIKNVKGEENTHVQIEVS